VSTNENENATDTIKIAHTFYLIGDAGNADLPLPQQTLELLSQKLASAHKNSTLLFLGDNIYRQKFIVFFTYIVIDCGMGGQQGL